VPITWPYNPPLQLTTGSCRFERWVFQTLCLHATEPVNVPGLSRIFPLLSGRAGRLPNERPLYARMLSLSRSEENPSASAPHVPARTRQALAPRDTPRCCGQTNAVETARVSAARAPNASRMSRPVVRQRRGARRPGPSDPRPDRPAGWACHIICWIFHPLSVLTKCRWSVPQKVVTCTLAIFF
jgi:hypothetical protein